MSDRTTLTLVNPDGSVEVRQTPITEHSWIVGLDLGRQNDYTALTAVEQTRPPGVDARYDVRQILRTRGKPYPAVVDAVGEFLTLPDLRGATLVCDATGVGLAVVDMFVQAGLRPIAVTITGGLDVVRVPDGYHVPKRELVTTTEVLLQQGRLHIAANLPHTRTLTEELASFEVHISQAGHDTYSARVGEHDDLVLAVALACWFGERTGRTVAF